MMRFFAVTAALLLTGCGQSAADKAAEQAQVDEAFARGMATAKQLEALQANQKPAASQSSAGSVGTELQQANAQEERGEGWCFKDYCPCEDNPDNNATEQLHCDMMETGGDVDDQLLAVGRSMREARRQMRTGDY